MLARAGRELAAGGLGVVDRLADGRVVHVEDVVEQERRALEGRQPLEREQQRDRQIVGERSAAGSATTGSGNHVPTYSSRRWLADFIRSRHSRETTRAR